MSERHDRNKFTKHFERAQGWLGLEQFDAAERALNEIPSAYLLRQEVVTFRCELHLAAKKWDAAAALAEQLAKAYPDRPEYWVHWAYATRRYISIAAAEDILRRAVQLHPGCAMIPFNLACYAAMTGRFNEVAALLKTATTLEPEMEIAARHDPDLKPYWDDLKIG